jgi:hypothetical protein
MKLPQIQENCIKTLQGTPSNNTQEVNAGGNKGKGKVNQICEIEKTAPKKQYVVNASLIRKHVKFYHPTFLLDL